MVHRILLQATYRGTESQWLRLSAYFEHTDEPRLAKAIKDGIGRVVGSRYYHRPDRQYALRFRGGSIAKIDKAIAKGVTNE